MKELIYRVRFPWQAPEELTDVRSTTAVGAARIAAKAYAESNPVGLRSLIVFVTKPNGYIRRIEFRVLVEIKLPVKTDCRWTEKS